MRNRGSVVFPAGSSSVKDNKDHYPINNINQARNALARASQHKSSPPWYSGSLSSLVSAVRRAVHSKYPKIKETEKSKNPKKGYELIDNMLTLAKTGSLEDVKKKLMINAQEILREREDLSSPEDEGVWGSLFDQDESEGGLLTPRETIELAADSLGRDFEDVEEWVRGAEEGEPLSLVDILTQFDAQSPNVNSDYLEPEIGPEELPMLGHESLEEDQSFEEEE